MPPLLIADLRGGRNGSDPPLMLPDTQCTEAYNVDWWEGTLAHRRGGSANVSLAFSSGGPFANGIGSLIRHVPGTDETAAELWAADGSLQIGRLAGGVTWTEPTTVDPPTLAGIRNMFGASLGGLLFLAYDSAENRLHVWDGTTNRRVGVATPAVPTVASIGAGGLSFTRFYRVRFVEISGSDTRRRSEPSPSVSITIAASSGVRVTRPAVVSEGETHWDVEYAEADAGPWYRASQVGIGTATYDDTAATIDTTLPLSADDGDHIPPASFKYIVRGGARLLMAGPHETSGGFMTPLDHEVWWTPVLGANDIGDLERMPPDHRLALDHAIVGLSEAINGVHYAFGQRTYSALVPTGLPGAGAFARITETSGVGCIKQQTIVHAEDESGAAAVYFLSHNGPYRISAGGLQYCGNDIEDVWASVNLDAAIFGHGLYYADKHQIWWWVAVDGNSQPSVKLVFDTRLGRFIDTGDDRAVRFGWSKHVGQPANCSVLFSDTIGASMSHRLVPYLSHITGTVLWECDTGTDDAGTDFEAYVETKEYAPAGLGRNCSVTEPHLVGEANALSSVTVTAKTDFGLDSSVSGVVSLAPQLSETRVQRKFEGFEISGIGTVRFRIGDAAATDPGFGTLDAFVAHVESGEPR